MNDRSFDSITRQTAGGISRRTSLLSLGAAGLMAAFAGPLTADAEQVSADKKGHKNKKKKKSTKQPPDLCAPQVDPCVLTLSISCGGDPSCQDSVACCSHFATCDASGFWSCLVSSTGN